MKPAVAVQQFGQSIWLDNISRGLLTSGEFQRLVDEDGVTGVTSNPTIFEKAIAAGADYDPALRALVGEGRKAAEIFDAVAVEDLQQAADILRPVWERTGGRDGFVSMEVAPDLALDTEGSIEAARRYWAALDRPNAMIKIPGTLQGLPAIEQCLAEGININITLLFSVERYAAVMEAYLRAVERRVEAGQPVDKLASVASFFVSRVDTAVDRQIDAKAAAASASEREELLALRGKAAIANAKVAYARFKETFAGPRWERLAAAGAPVQRPLWASTGTKDPAYSDVLYVDTLIGPHTVNTLPPATLTAFNDHGAVAATLEQDPDEARATLDALAKHGIDLESVTVQLEREGVDAFIKSFNDLLGGISGKRDALLKDRAARTTAQLGQLKAPVAEALMELEGAQFAKRLWAKDGTIWSKEPADIASAENRLGWLDSPEAMSRAAADLRAFAAELHAEGFTDAVVLGMGGSSLAPEVFAQTFGGATEGCRLHVLDSTDPATVIRLGESLDLEHTLFIASSKSGTTTESLAFLEYFWAKRPEGRQYVVITDPGTPLETMATERGFRRAFINPADIGGRYSVMSYFGLVPAAVLGMDLDRLLDRACGILHACGPNVPPRENPGLWLGGVMGRAARSGRDKLTLVTSPGVASFGIWVEQLIAESTGKHGRGIIPVAGERLGAPDAYGADRLFVALQLEGETDAEQDAALAALEAAGHPVIRIALRDRYDLGGEFVRWEVATAAAGMLLKVNPFDEPNVQEAKDITRRFLREWEMTGALPKSQPVLDNGVQVYSAPPALTAVRRATSATEALERFAGLVKPGDYIAILAFLRQTPERDELLEALRARLRDRHKVAVTIGYGPRYLHSTGQLHKGGPASGAFLVLTGDAEDDAPVPGTQFPFSVLIAAQALGDTQALQARARRVMRIHLGAKIDTALASL